MTNHGLVSCKLANEQGVNFIKYDISKLFIGVGRYIDVLTKVNNRLWDCQRQWAQPGAIATYEDQCFEISAMTGSVGIVLSHCSVIRENARCVICGPFGKESIESKFDSKRNQNTEVWPEREFNMIVLLRGS